MRLAAIGFRSADPVAELPRFSTNQEFRHGDYEHQTAAVSRQAVVLVRMSLGGNAPTAAVPIKLAGVPLCGWELELRPAPCERVFDPKRTAPIVSLSAGPPCGSGGQTQQTEVERDSTDLDTDFPPEPACTARPARDND